MNHSLVIVALACLVSGPASALDVGCDFYRSTSGAETLRLNGEIEGGGTSVTMTRPPAERQVGWTLDGAIYCGRGDEPCEAAFPALFRNASAADPDATDEFRSIVQHFVDDGRNYLVFAELTQSLERGIDAREEKMLAVTHEAGEAPNSENMTVGNVWRCRKS